MASGEAAGNVVEKVGRWRWKQEVEEGGGKGRWKREVERRRWKVVEKLLRESEQRRCVRKKRRKGYIPPGCTLRAVIPLPPYLSTNAVVNSIFASFDCPYDAQRS